mgnify:CR=1 FL=1
MASESSKLSAFQLASLFASYGSMFGYGSPLQMLAEQLKDSAQGSIMAQAQLVAQKRAKPKGLKKILGDISPLLTLVSSLINPVLGAATGATTAVASKQNTPTTYPDNWWYFNPNNNII